MEILKNFLSGAGGAALVAGVFALIQWKLNRKAAKEDKKGKEIQSLESSVDKLTIAMRAILYDRIKHLAKNYIQKGYITVEEYEDLKRMHSVYHNEMKGNGFLDGIMEEVEYLEKRV